MGCLVTELSPLNLGIVGLSEGNGHPFSFSAIVNGFEPSAMKQSGWEPIYNYLMQRHSSEFGFSGVRITHVWTQSEEQSRLISKACHIPKVCRLLSEMVFEVDAVLIARDDFDTHFEMAMPFLKAGKCVFVDKPLDLNTENLRQFLPYLQSGHLMSCAGLRYARELDPLRAEWESFGKVQIVRGTVSGPWDRYGVHMLDGIFSMTPCRVLSVIRLPSEYFAVALRTVDGPAIEVACIQPTVKTFRFDIWGSKRREHVDVNDNFSAFRRLLWEFICMVRSKKQPVPVELTMDVMRILIAGVRADQQKREVRLDEVQI